MQLEKKNLIFWSKLSDAVQEKTAVVYSTFLIVKQT